jgi:hypothetical protein
VSTAPTEAPAAQEETPRSSRKRTDWVPVDTTLGQVLRGLRWAAIGLYLVVLVYEWHKNGVPFYRTGLLLWISIGLGCACIGRHPIWLLWVVVDFLPLAAVLIAYDRLRGWSYTAGMPTWWQPQLSIDRALFVGHEPTIVFQEYLKYPQVRWWDVAVCICYFSFFFLPYLLAAVMWLRSRADFYRWSLRFVALSFLGFTLFVLIPSAPPWAAARCVPSEVADHPHSPPCIFGNDRPVPGNLLGEYHSHVSGSLPWVQRIAVRGFGKLHLTVAKELVEKGQGWGDAVAAVPSLHVGGTVLFVLFMWNRVNRWWHPLLAAYPILMQFSLTYGGEHYIADGIAGALCAWLIHSVANRIEQRLTRRRAPDTLGSTAPPDTTQESSCPPIHPPPGMTPSST